MERFVGKFETDGSKWLGFDKNEKFVYGVQCSYGNLVDIIAKSIFGGNVNLVYRSSNKNNWNFVRAILMTKKYMGFLISDMPGVTFTDFYLFSFENKLFEKYKLQSHRAHRPHQLDGYVFEKLLYFSVFDWWILVGLDYWSPIVYRLELNKSAKTFSLVFLTRVSFDMYGSVIIAFGNEINVLPPEMDSLLVYNIMENFWLPKKHLIKSTQIAFTLYRHQPVCCVMSAEDGKDVLIAPSYEVIPETFEKCVRLYKLVNNVWEPFFTLAGFSENMMKNMLWSNDLLLFGDNENTYIINTKVMSLKDLAFKKIFCALCANGMCLKDMKDVLNLPTFLNRQYFAHV